MKVFMNGQVCEQLTLFQEDFPVSRSPLPGSEEARMMTAISGRKCSELYGSSGPLGFLVRMCLESSIWHSTKCLLIWKTKATKHKRLLFQLAASMPRTDETESRLLPTVTAMDAARLDDHPRKEATLTRSILLSQLIRKRFPDAELTPEIAEWMMGYTKAFTQLIPTPRASDYKGAAAQRFYGGGVLQASALRADRGHSAWDYWPAEPGICRVDDGIPNRMDRIKSLGNAVVPQQFYLFFKLMADIEKGAAE